MTSAAIPTEMPTMAPVDRELPEVDAGAVGFARTVVAPGVAVTVVTPVAVTGGVSKSDRSDDFHLI